MFYIYLIGFLFVYLVLTWALFLGLFSCIPRRQAKFGNRALYSGLIPHASHQFTSSHKPSYLASACQSMPILSSTWAKSPCRANARWHCLNSTWTNSPCQTPKRWPAETQECIFILFHRVRYPILYLYQEFSWCLKKNTPYFHKFSLSIEHWRSKC